MRLNIERSILSCLMLDDSNSTNILMDLNEKDFSYDLHRQIYESMHKLMIKEMNIDCLLVLNELFNFHDKKGTHNDNSIRREIEVTIYEMVNEVPSVKNLDSYVKALKEYRNS